MVFLGPRLRGGDERTADSRCSHQDDGDAFTVENCGGGSGLYLLAFLCAALYPVSDRRTFSGIAAVLLALPWIDYLPDAWPSLLVAAALNAIIIYVLLAALSLAPPLLRRLLRSD